MTATNTTPVIQNVMMIVESMYCQLEAIGVHHHGLTRWNTTEPTASRIRTIAKIIAYGSLRAPQLC